MGVHCLLETTYRVQQKLKNPQKKKNMPWLSERGIRNSLFWILSWNSMTTDNMFSWKDKKNALWANLLIQNFVKCIEFRGRSCWAQWLNTLGILLLSFRHHSERYFFAQRFILIESILFWLTRSYQKPFVFSVSVFYFSNMYPKIKFTAKIRSDLCNFCSKVIFGFFCLWKYFVTFLCWISIIGVSQQYCENFRKIKQVELVENLPPSYIPYRFPHTLHSFLLWEKEKIIDFLKTND